MAGRSHGALTDAKRQVLHLLKRCRRATASELARTLGVTDVAVRQHLTALQDRGFVESVPEPAAGRRGRPSIHWSLTALAGELFPDHHADLTVNLLTTMRAALGADGLDRIIDQRAREQVAEYQAAMPPRTAALRTRVAALAARRTAEGYMAEVVREKPGVYLLVEHHCPICAAATTCQALCGAELGVFRAVLGPDVTVERTTHLLNDGDRCVYRIHKRR